jgi:hypothetical protein
VFTGNFSQVLLHARPKAVFAKADLRNAYKLIPVNPQDSPAMVMSFQLAKNLIFHIIFLRDMQNNFHFLVDSGTSLSILPHASTEPPMGSPSAGRANGKTIPAWGFRQSFCLILRINL